jgi:transposase
MDAQEMKAIFNANRRKPVDSEIKCAYCAKPLTKTTSNRQFCTSKGSYSCGKRYYRLVVLNAKPSPERTGADCKLDAINHKRPILNDIKTMTRTAVAKKYGIHVSTLYNYLVRWGCYSVIGSTPSALTPEDESLIHELYETMTMQQIADIFEVSKPTIQRALEGNDSRMNLMKRIGAEIVSMKQVSTGTVDTGRKLIVECKRKPAFVLVPIEEYLRENKK